MHGNPPPLPPAVWYSQQTLDPTAGNFNTSHSARDKYGHLKQVAWFTVVNNGKSMAVPFQRVASIIISYNE
jgi:hypothetical protein